MHISHTRFTHTRTHTHTKDLHTRFTHTHTHTDTHKHAAHARTHTSHAHTLYTHTHTHSDEQGQASEDEATSAQEQYAALEPEQQEGEQYTAWQADHILEHNEPQDVTPDQHQHQHQHQHQQQCQDGKTMEGGLSSSF